MNLHSFFLVLISSTREETLLLEVSEPLSLLKEPHPKEYIRSSKLDQCSLQATTAMKYKLRNPRGGGELGF